jgi:hypothetical protein
MVRATSLCFLAHQGPNSERVQAPTGIALVTASGAVIAQKFVENGKLCSMSSRVMSASFPLLILALCDVLSKDREHAWCNITPSKT